MKNKFFNKSIDKQFYVDVISDTDLERIEDYECEIFDNELKIIANICIEWEYTDLWITFKCESEPIYLDDIDFEDILKYNEPYYTKFEIFYSNFINCKYNPHNIDDICDILAARIDTDVIGEDLPTNWSEIINKDPNILTNLNLLIEKFNINNLEYDKTNISEILDTLEELNIIRDSCGYKNLKEDLEKVDKNIADKIMKSLQQICIDAFNPDISLADGIIEEIKTHIKIKIHD